MIMIGLSGDAMPMAGIRSCTPATPAITIHIEPRAVGSLASLVIIVLHGMRPAPVIMSSVVCNRVLMR